MVTEGVVHGVHMVVIQLSFGVIWQHKASGHKVSHKVGHKAAYES